MQLQSVLLPQADQKQDSENDMHSLLQRPLPSSARETSPPEHHDTRHEGVRIGQVVQAGEEGLLVLLPGMEVPVAAHALCVLSAADVGRSCAVLFVEGDARRPLVVGCVVDEPACLQQTQRHPALMPAAEAPTLKVDGEVVHIEARQELELRCGEAVIVLQRDGRIEIRGNYVTSQATATQRLRGGSVHIN